MKKTKAAVSKAKQQVKTAVKQTKQVVKKQVLPVVKKAAQATTKAVKNAVKPKNLLNTLQTGLDKVGMVPVVGEVADGVNGIIYAARGDKVNAALSFGAMIPVVGNAATAGKWVNKGAKAAKGISESAQKANKGLLGNVKEKVNKQVSNVKTQIQARVDEVKQQLRQLRAPQTELAGVNVVRMSDTGTVGKNTSSSSPKPSNSQPPQNGSNKKPDENKGTDNAKLEDKSSPILSGGLSEHELKGGHLIERHVGKTDEELLERLKSNSKISGSSTFKDITTAEQVANTVLTDPKNIKKIEKWLSNPDSNPTLPLKYKSDGEIIGRSVSKGSEIVEDVTKARIVLKKDKEGSFILTGYPEK